MGLRPIPRPLFVKSGAKTFIAKLRFAYVKDMSNSPGAMKSTRAVSVSKNSPKEKKLQIAGGARGGEARLESNQMPRKPCLARLAAHEVGTFTLRSGGKVTAFSGCEKSLTRLFDSLNGAEPHVDIRRPGPRWSPRWSPQREPPRRGRPGAGA